MVAAKIPTRGALCLVLVALVACQSSEPVTSQAPTALATSEVATQAAPTRDTVAPAPTTISAPTSVSTPASPAPATSATTDEQVVHHITSMSVTRAAHTATLLPSGRVLIAGGCVLPSCETGERSASAELYDPTTGMFTPANSMTTPRVGNSATSLPDGRVLIAGGWSGARPTASAELYDPATGVFTPTGSLHTPRGGHTETLLADGRVLLAGGYDGRQSLNSAEMYDPRTGAFTPARNMTTPRNAHTASLLHDGRVLIAGGSSGSGDVLNSAEIYDPARGDFQPTGGMTAIRHKHAAVTLQDGRVLIVGGSDARDGLGQYASTELYDPTSGGFQPGARMRAQRFKLPAAVVLLPNGEVLVAGSDTRVEIYNPDTASFRTVMGKLDADRAFSTATLLPDGQVLIAGGYDNRIALTADTWLYRP